MADKKRMTGLMFHPKGDGGRDRRGEARMAVARPVKLQCATTGRYFSARTCDVSRGGALMEIEHPSLLVTGQRLRMGIGWTSQQAVLPADSLAGATVVRSLGLGTRQHVAVMFDQAQQLAMAG